MDSAISEQKVLKGNSERTYKLLDLLGDGLTAQVFRAQADNPDELVAVKVLRPGLEESIVERFESEHRNVVAVWNALSVAAIDQGGAAGPNDLKDSPATPPRPYEFCAAVDQQPAFVAMELMSGRKVEWLLAEQGAFAELLGLRLGLQLFGLLHILHDRMRRSYDDFKFENLWWEAEAQRLRVTDWNVMGDEKDLGVRVPWDLERGARVLLRVLTGAPLRPELRLDQQPRWSQLSAGVQALLKRMLEMDRNRRPKTAEEICKELSLLIGYWLIESGRGLRNIEAALDGIAYGQDAAMLDEETLRRIEPTVRQTLAALSILHLRQQQETAAMSQAWPVALVQQLDTLQARAEQYAPSPERMVNTALTLLNGHSFPAAAAKLRDAVQLFPDHLPAHRWLELAEAMAAGKALAVGENHRWREAIGHCGAGDFQEAHGVLAKLPIQFAAGLRGEVTVRLAIQQAQGDSAQIEEKQEQVGKALTALAEMRENRHAAYAAALQESLGIELENWKKSLTQQVEAKQRQAQAATEASEFRQLSTSSGLEKGVKRAEERLHLFLDESAVVEAVLQLGMKCLNAKRYRLAERVFYTGAVLDHDRAPAFRLRWLVARAAYLRSINDPHAAGEMDQAGRAVQDARQGNTETVEALNDLWGCLAPSEQSLDTTLFERTLKKALENDKAGVLAVKEKHVDISRLVSALDDKLKAQDLSRLDNETREALDAMVQNHTGLSPAVLAVLMTYNSEPQRALSQPQDETQAKEALARTLDFPYHKSIELVKKLLSAESNPQKKAMLARQWRDMAYACGAEAKELQGSLSLSPPDPGPKPEPTLAPQSSSDALMEALNSDDPRRWEEVMNTDQEGRRGWPLQVKERAQQRASEISRHRSEMAKVLKDFDQDPTQVKEGFATWRKQHPRWVRCWDARKGNWVETEALEQEIGRASDTAQARKWLGHAQMLQRQVASPSEISQAVATGVAFTGADPEVMRQLEELRRNSIGAIQPTPGIRPLPGAVRPDRDATTVSSPPLGNLQALLERPIRESETLTDLRKRIQGLLQANSKDEDILKAQYDSLGVWELDEHWLASAEQTHHVEARAQSHAVNTLQALEVLTKQEYWHPYIPTEGPTVFAITRKRLERIVDPEGTMTTRTRVPARHK